MRITIALISLCILALSAPAQTVLDDGSVALFVKDDDDFYVRNPMGVVQQYRAPRFGVDSNDTPTCAMHDPGTDDFYVGGDGFVSRVQVTGTNLLNVTLCGISRSLDIAQSLCWDDQGRIIVSDDSSRSLRRITLGSSCAWQNASEPILNSGTQPWLYHQLAGAAYHPDNGLIYCFEDDGSVWEVQGYKGHQASGTNPAYYFVGNVGTYVGFAVSAGMVVVTGSLGVFEIQTNGPVPAPTGAGVAEANLIGFAGMPCGIGGTPAIAMTSAGMTAAAFEGPCVGQVRVHQVCSPGFFGPIAVQCDSNVSDGRVIALTMVQEVTPPPTAFGVLAEGFPDGSGAVAITSFPAGAATGRILISTQTTGPAGGGPILGLHFDPMTFALVNAFPAPIVANPLHFPAGPTNRFPNRPYNILPGHVTALLGQTWDAMAIALGPSGQLLAVSPVTRFTW